MRSAPAQQRAAGRISRHTSDRNEATRAVPCMHGATSSRQHGRAGGRGGMRDFHGGAVWRCAARAGHLAWLTDWPLARL